MPSTVVESESGVELTQDSSGKAVICWETTGSRVLATMSGAAPETSSCWSVDWTSLPEGDSMVTLTPG
ncbi:hypothetical protein N7U49_45710 [Streptomyces sp. AD2-2]|nr:hypothetical protein N7U49_45710 [Streptomyces sp. AD2-2]